MSQYQIIAGDVVEGLGQLEDESVNTCVTSPPYWALRDYGVQGQIGLEKTPEEYTETMVGVFREVRRVLRDDGTLWLNLGDCFATGAGKVGKCPGGGVQGEKWRGGDNSKHNPGIGPITQPNRMPIPGLKSKDLVGIPWRVAFALQADGWFLRSDIIWSKPNPMPESVTDRPTKSHEYIFLLSKQPKYYYDHKAIKEPATDIGRINGRDGRQEKAEARPPGSSPRTLKRLDYTKTGRNKRSVWTIPTKSYSDAHFATFPEKLIIPCILAGSPKGGVVLDPFCGRGTTGVVAVKRGRRFIGVELNPEYAKLSESNVEEASRQQLLEGVV